MVLHLVIDLLPDPQSIRKAQQISLQSTRTGGNAGRKRQTHIQCPLLLFRMLIPSWASSTLIPPEMLCQHIMVCCSVNKRRWNLAMATLRKLRGGKKMTQGIANRFFSLSLSCHRVIAILIKMAHYAECKSSWTLRQISRGLSHLFPWEWKSHN